MTLPVGATFPGALRHIGPSEADAAEMLKVIGVASRDELVAKTVPHSIQTIAKLNLPEGVSETAALAELKAIMDENEVFKPFIGKGYHGTHTPYVILRNIVENPAWYTPYTPYQAEISQGRLEMLLNYQTMCCDLTGFPVASASLLDEATAAAEALMMLWGRSKASTVLVDANTHPQTLDVIRTRAKGFGWTVIVAAAEDMPSTASEDVFAVVLQYPGSDGAVADMAPLVAQLKAKHAGIKVAVATDLLALTTLTPPGEWGADAAFGSSQRLGVPLGFGGPHAAFLCTSEAYKRKMPGRIIGVSKDSRGKPALRMAMQAREQHIRREKASSNICTAQALLANVAAAYGIWHGPAGLTAIAREVNSKAVQFAGLITSALGAGVVKHNSFFDTVTLTLPSTAAVEAALSAAAAHKINFFARGNGSTEVSVSFDETSDASAPAVLAGVFATACGKTAAAAAATSGFATPASVARSSAFMTHPVFHSHRSETSMLRYLYSLQQKDLSLATAMIPLGSCTMKLNATSEMIPITWPTVNALHPFAPETQTKGYKKLLTSLSSWLCTVTGFDACSLQPNSGAQGEFAGLLAIQAYHAARGQAHRDVCLIPASAHGTNPASAAMAGLRIVVVACDAQGNIDVADLEAKAQKHAAELAAIQLTYPSTHGVFEEGVREVCTIVHRYGGQVYLDGANMNAQVGLTSPGDIGADVCHLNLHKTFCIPHGGGGPGVGPICVRSHLAPFLPGHVFYADAAVPVAPEVAANHPTGSYVKIPDAFPAPAPAKAAATGAGAGALAINVTDAPSAAVSAAPYGSASILPIPWMYMRMMGSQGLRAATEMAILNANYMMARLQAHYPVLFVGAQGRCAHEFILDIRDIKAASGISEEDIAKRLMDFNFHAPTMSFPVPGTLMIEPTESESRYELDRFCDALIAIRGEIAEVEAGRADKVNNVLKNAPHTADMCLSDAWSFPYGREQAAYPKEYLRTNKYWPTVGRLDNVFGDRNVVCTCPPIESYSTLE
jgi:glycine dehydrogenase